jgi:cell pole-organizing protein PopZ
VANNSEASVEEILESIKKVIARDNRESALQMRNRKSTPSQDAEIPDQSGEEEAVLDPNDGVLDLAEMELSEAIEIEDDGETPLLADEVREAMHENLAALAMLSQPPARPQIVRSGETSLEGLTRELLRPMLAEWLDKNLPSMVEKMVQAEIARIAGKRG